MKREIRDRGALLNRLAGLLLIAAVVVVFCVWTPHEDYQHRRGAIELLRDFGGGVIATKFRLAVDWAIGGALVLAGLYMLVTGERIRRPEF